METLHQADTGLNSTLPFSVCTWAIHFSKLQFTHLTNRNKNNTYVLVSVQSKTWKPLDIFQVLIARALMKGIRSFHSCWKGWESNRWEKYIEDLSYITTAGIFSSGSSCWPSQAAGGKQVNLGSSSGRCFKTHVYVSTWLSSPLSKSRQFNSIPKVNVATLWLA